MTSEVHIFVGPSLPPVVRPSDPCFFFHGPVSQGEVYRLVDSAPRAIAIVDGYFERMPAVWHKEILWALSQGIHVFGAASMGALRAAELHQFGMVGVGVVYQAFRDGHLVDDDEVTLVHGDHTQGYWPVSEAMVNVRATLDAALKAGSITRETRETLVQYMKGLYYPDRNYADLLGWAQGKIPDAEREALYDAICRPGGRVDQKQDDALLLLERLREFVEEAPPALRVPWHFQHTDAWETVRRRALNQIES